MSSSNIFSNLDESIDYSRKYKKLKKEYNDLEKYLKSVFLNHNNEIDTLKKEYSELGKEYSELFKTFEYNEKIAQNYEKTISKYENTVDKYEDKIENLSNIIKNQNKENDKLSKKLTVVAHKLDTCLKKTNKDSESDLTRETMLKNIINKHLIEPKRRTSNK